MVQAAWGGTFWCSNIDFGILYQFSGTNGSIPNVSANLSNNFFPAIGIFKHVYFPYKKRKKENVRIFCIEKKLTY